MQYPDFYTHVPSIKLYDPLSGFLGAFNQGEVDISYLDCVKLAGHSCPTVAGAYLMASKGLETLYKGSLPKRGTIKVEMKMPEEEGVTGVIGNVIAFIVGASGKGGFKGIQGKYSRDKLISYNVPMQAAVKLTRLDTNKSVLLRYDPSIIPADEMMQPLMGKNLKGLATEEEKKMFQKLWQQRVEKILLHPNDTELLTIIKD